MPVDSVSYNLILFIADGGPYDSRKLQNGRPKQRSWRRRKGGLGMVKTHFGNLALPPLLLQLPMGSNKREDLDK